VLAVVVVALVRCATRRVVWCCAVMGC
jgi:hypothetical protein